jgi:hypothetical protein
MNMIRKAIFGMSLLALSAGSAFAAPAATHHVSKPRTVAEASAPAADSTAPAADKTEKKAKKSKGKKDKGGDAAKTEGAKEMKAAPSPAK